MLWSWQKLLLRKALLKRQYSVAFPQADRQNAPYGCISLLRLSQRLIRIIQIN